MASANGAGDPGARVARDADVIVPAPRLEVGRMELCRGAVIREADRIGRLRLGELQRIGLVDVPFEAVDRGQAAEVGVARASRSAARTCPAAARTAACSGSVAGGCDPCGHGDARGQESWSNPGVIALERNLARQAVAAVAQLQLDPLDRNVLAPGDGLYVESM